MSPSPFFTLRSPNPTHTYINSQLLSLKKMPQKPRSDKPKRIALPHPIYTLKGTDICLFVKDHKGEGHKEAKEQHAKMENTGITKVRS